MPPHRHYHQSKKKKLGESWGFRTAATRAAISEAAASGPSCRCSNISKDFSGCVGGLCACIHFFYGDNDGGDRLAGRRQTVALLTCNPCVLFLSF